MPRFRCRARRPSGAVDVRVIEAESAEAARGRLIAAGLEPIDIEAIGPSLLEGLRTRGDARWQWPAWPGETRPMLAAVALASLPFTVAIGSWALAWQADHGTAQLTREAALAASGVDPGLSATARVELTAAMSRRTISEMALRLGLSLPQDASVHAMASDDAGRITIEIDTPDPDQLRSAIAGDPYLSTFDEIGQTRTESATMRVALRSRAP